MDFLNKISHFFRKKFRKNDFQKQVKEEKKQKYLFRDDVESHYSAKRAKKKKIWGKKSSEKNNNFSNFFQQQFEKMGDERDVKHFMGAVGVLLFLLSGYIIFFSSYFKVNPTKVVVEALSEGIDSSSAYRALESIYGKSIFLLNEKQIAESIKENLKNVESVRIDKLFPNGVKILIKSLPTVFDTSIFSVENKHFGISSNGVLIPFSDLKETTFNKTLEIVSEDLRSEVFLSYKKVLTDKMMFLILKTFEVFESEWPDMKIAKARFFLQENELHLLFESNTKAILAFQDSMGEATPGKIPNMLLDEMITLRTYIKNNYNKMIDGSLTYIDARIPGKLFVCENNDQCKKNLTLIYGPVYE